MSRVVNVSYHFDGGVKMNINRASFIRLKLLWLAGIAIIFAVSIANAQQTSTAPQQEAEVAKVVNQPPASAANVPLYKDYRGIRIGMTADEVRSTLDGLKKDTAQDFFVFSEKESAQIYYDEQGKVTAISIDYYDGNANAPSPEVVLGAAVEPKPDGSLYQLKRYADSGYWVSYNRTAGAKPIVTITMQKM
jgi:hypothetical protein